MIERNGQEYLDEADYQTIVDEMTRQDTNQESLKYLKDTDWYEIRAISGKPVPEDILTKRQEARDSIVESN